MTDPKPYRHRALGRMDCRHEWTTVRALFLPLRTPERVPMTIIQHTVWRCYRFRLSDRDVQEVLYQRGIQISHETLRE
jgi:transposase-like protein